nr:unnamed protein product [Spirometra erinaceieuropaei]
MAADYDESSQNSGTKNPSRMWYTNRMLAHVTDNKAVSEAFAVATRVKKSTDGQLLNQQQMHLQSDASITAVQELLFAYARVVDVATEEEMQKRMDLFAVAHNNFGLVINTEKTGVMHQPPSEAASSAL